MTEDWEIAAFSAERASGTLRAPSTGREVSFPLEAWVPCEPDVAQGLQDSDERRHLLLPRVGEPVEVTWRKGWRGDDVPARVRRATALERVLPRVAFRDWLARVGRLVPELAGWTDAEWRDVFARAAEVSDGALEDTVNAAAPGHPEQHLGVLAWLVARAPCDVVARRLGWLREAAVPGARRAEAWGAPSGAWLTLDAATMAALEAERLVVFAD